MSFKQRLQSQTFTLGTWIKTPHPQVVEVLALSDLEVLVLDAEHAPFDRGDLDLCIMAARGGGMPVLVRPASGSPEELLTALDLGADGVVVPHVRSVAEAEAVVRACHYGPGGRGFAGSTRAARYTTLGMAGHRAAARDVTVVAQIEDADALAEIDGIARVEGIDALFIGRADLTLSLGADTPDDPAVIAAVGRVCDAGRAAGRAIGMFLGRPADAAAWRERGVSLFLLQSDQEFLLAGAARLRSAVEGN